MKGWGGSGKWWGWDRNILVNDPYLLFFLYIIQIILLLPLLHLCGRGKYVSIMKNEREKESEKERGEERKKERETGKQAWEVIKK